MFSSQDTGSLASYRTESNRTGGLRILLVGMDEDSCSTLTRLLRTQGHDVRAIAPRSLLRETDWKDWSDVIIEAQDQAMGERDSIPTPFDPFPNRKRPLLILVTPCASNRVSSDLFEDCGDLQLVKPLNPAFLLRVLDRFQAIICD